jgi:hypothetical protein
MDTRKVPILIPKRTVAARQGVCVRTVDRRVQKGLISPPLKIDERDYWPDDQAEADRQALIDRALARHA